MSIFSKNQTKKVVVNAENHGYKPNTVTFKQGKPAQLKFIPSDNMGCMNEVVSKDLNIDQKLDGKKEVTIDIPQARYLHLRLWNGYVPRKGCY